MPLHYTHDYCQDRIYSDKGSAPALNTAQRHTVAHALRGEGFDASEDGTGRGTPIVPEVANPLTARMHKGINTTADEGQTPLPVAFSASDYSTGDFEQCNVARPLTTTADRTRGAPIVSRGSLNQTPTLSSADRGSNRTPALHQGIAVRRLTPVECERLQGFPDNFTRIPWRGKDPENCPDGPRYKALGNSMAVNAMEWIGERIQMIETMNERSTT